MGYKAAVQVLKSADALKMKVSRKCDLLNDSEAWTDQQQLQTIYHQVLVLDLEYALDKKVEQELWTLGFKNHISTLQELARDKKNPKRSETQALLSWCLESASGFYLTLLQELCTTFDLDLPFRRKGTLYGQLKSTNPPEQITTPQSSSCLYICQYCLVHLGDIARYRNQRKQAESFYKQAILVSPTSGHPYNQLALLEASQGDKLSTVFNYVKGIAVKNPFPATATNLANTLSAIVDKDEAVTEVQTKLTVNEFIKLFLRVHGLLHSLTDLKQAETTIKSLNSTLTALIATQSFTSDKLIKLTVINMYALRHTVGSNVMKSEELTNDEVKAKELILDLMAGSLSAYLLPVYTLKTDESLLDYYALPAIKLILYWIEKQPEVLKETVFTNRLQIWPGFCKLLNNIQPFLTDINDNKYSKYPLSEDRDLQGFLPLADKFIDFDFKAQFDDIADKEKYMRAKRLIQLGKWLMTFDVNNTKLITSKDPSASIICFEPGCIQPDPTDQLLEEMKSFSIQDKSSNKLKERRGGILKPQGSLEKAREERELQAGSETNSSFDLSSSTSSSSVSSNYTKLEATKLKRAKQNVALQSIYKKMEENKQVKFSSETADNEKEKPLKTKPPVKLPNTTHLSQPFRTQTFNQNHPAFPSTSSDIPKDFFTPPPPIHTRPPPPNISSERNMAGNIMFSNNGLDPINKPPNMSYNMAAPTPTPPMFGNNANVGQSMTNGNVYNMPPPPMNPFQLPIKSNPPYQQPQMPQQPQQAPQPPQQRQFNNTWNNDDRKPNTGGWWPQNQQMPPPQPSNFPQRDNFASNYQYNSNAMSNMSPYPTNGVTIDYSKSQMFTNPWSGGMQQNAPVNNQGMMGGYNSANQAMSMRQAMLNETKHNVNVGSTMPGSNAAGLTNMTSDKMQMPQNTPGYSLFNSSSWSPNIPGQIRTGQNENIMNNIPGQSLFNMNSPSLKQLLEQQNQLHKDK